MPRPRHVARGPGGHGAPAGAGRAVPLRRAASRADGGSVHLAPFPGPGVEGDEPLDRAMDVVRRLASLARSAREDVGIRCGSRSGACSRDSIRRGPGGVRGAGAPTAVRSQCQAGGAVTHGTDLVTLEARPTFRALGKRFGKATPDAAEAIRHLAPADVARFEAGEPVSIELNGERHPLVPGDLTVHRQARGDVVVRADGASWRRSTDAHRGAEAGRDGPRSRQQGAAPAARRRLPGHRPHRGLGPAVTGRWRTRPAATPITLRGDAGAHADDRQCGAGCGSGQDIELDGLRAHVAVRPGRLRVRGRLGDGT